MLEKRLATFFDEVAAKTSAPGGGAVAAIVVGLAAALAAMTARFSEKKLGEDAAEIAARADELRAEAGELAQADAEAYGAYLEAIRRPEDDPSREAAVRDATDRSAAVPLRIAEIGADGVVFLPAAQEKIEQFTANGFDKLPVCMAKTHLSLSHDPSLLNAPTGFTVTVRDIRAYTGSGWLVPLLGDMQTMPGYGVTPAAFSVDIDENGRTIGLF